MNIVKLQDDLKGLSDDQLKQTMMSGSAPQFLVLSEMQRRKKSRENPQGGGPAPGASVAEEYMAAGIPQMRSNLQMPEGGIAGYAAGGKVAAERWQKGEDDAAYDNPWTGRKERPPSSPDVRKPRKYASGGPVKAIDLIKQWEGYRDKAYKPTPDDPWTIGYGSTRGVSEGMKIDEQQAEAMLARDLAAVEEDVDRLVDVPLTPSQRAAVTSLIYNIGEGNFARSKARKALNAGDYDTFMDEAFSEERGFVKAGGEPLEGLINRRQAEQQAFLYGDGFIPQRESVQVASAGDDAGIGALLKNMGGAGGEGEYDAVTSAAPYREAPSEHKPEFELDEGKPHNPYDYTTVTTPDYERAYPIPEPTDDTPRPEPDPLKIIISGGREELPRDQWPDEQFKKRLQGFEEGGEVEGDDRYMRDPRDPYRPKSFTLPNGNGVSTTVTSEYGEEVENARPPFFMDPEFYGDLGRNVGESGQRMLDTSKAGYAQIPANIYSEVKEGWGGITNVVGNLVLKGQEKLARTMYGDAAVDKVKGMFEQAPPPAPEDQPPMLMAGNEQLPGTDVGFEGFDYPDTQTAQAAPEAPGQPPAEAAEPTDPYLDYIRGELAGSKSNKLADFLLQTGVGMMASDKQDTLQNLGIGAQQGVKGLMANRQAEAQRQRHLMDLEGAYRRGKVVADARGNSVMDAVDDMLTQKDRAQDEYQKAINDLVKRNPMALTEDRQAALIQKAMSDPQSDVAQAWLTLQGIDQRLRMLGFNPGGGQGGQGGPMPASSSGAIDPSKIRLVSP